MLISINRNTDLSAISGTPPQFRMILVWFHTFVMMTYSWVAFLTSSKVKVTWYVTLYTIFAKLKGNSNIICQNCMHKLKKWSITFPWQVIQRKICHCNISDAKVSKLWRWRAPTLNPIKRVLKPITNFRGVWWRKWYFWSCWEDLYSKDWKIS